ncbi:4-hydroxy-tetrahydrodipicolinate synthase [Parelusimicrobium proximum]|uniref:4-hydroxy-tetrahydrodipicolinate synthase n=1 Tax=Parelusimicrobium proximum TaxID=3228953 RepID=UPI003D180481
MFKGVYPALITPFHEDGKIDFVALEKNIEHQISCGADGIVLLGTTAETPCLSDTEKQDILTFALRHINKRIKVIVGVSGNATWNVLKEAEKILKFNPDGILAATPYYNKPNASGLKEHYKLLSALGTPIVLYHIPGRTGLKVPLNLMKEILEDAPMIKAIKESEYDISYLTKAAVELKGKVNLLSGNDDIFIEHLSLQYDGTITAAGNVLCKEFKEIYENRKDPAKAFDLFSKSFDKINACYLETNPTCVKYILSKQGLCGDTVRLPLGKISKETAAKIDKIFGF